MSTVKVPSFFTYHPSNEPQEVILNNTPMPKGKRAPENALVAYFGFRDFLDGVSEWRKEADRTGLGFCQVDIEVDVGQVFTVHTTPENLPETNFLNFRRMSRSLEDIVTTYWWDYLKAEGMSSEQLEGMEWRYQNYVAERPDLVSKLHDEPEFRHLTLIVHPVREDDGKMRQKAALFSDKAVVKITPIDLPNVHVTLPNLEARKQARLKPH